MQFKQGEGEQSPAAVDLQHGSGGDWLGVQRKVVIITGGASGLGNACATQLADQGARCVLLSDSE